MLRVLTRIVTDAIAVAALLFVAAGTLTWWRAWVLLTVLLVIRIITVLVVYRINPTLLLERAKLPIHRDQPWTDKLLLLSGLVTGFLGLPVIAALDVFRWHLLPKPAPFLASLGLVLYTLGWVVKAVALRTNAFATTVVRLQHERHHAVVDTGIYSIIRHPFYAGSPLVLLGTGLWLESWTAVLLATIPIMIVTLRLGLEERFLHRELPGYSEYAARVPHRLLPGIW